MLRVFLVAFLCFALTAIILTGKGIVVSGVLSKQVVTHLSKSTNTLGVQNDKEPEGPVASQE